MQIILLVIIILGFIFLLFSWFKLLQKKKKLDLMEARIHRHSEHSIELVRQKSEQIIQESVSKATEILKETKSVKEIDEKRLHTVLHQTAEKHMDILEEHLGEISKAFDDEFENLDKKYEKQARKTLSEMETTGESGLKKLENVLDKQTISLQTYLKHKVDLEFEKAQDEINDYKKAEIEKVKSSINILVKKVVTELLGKSIPLEEHDELLMEALEKAKNEGIFDYE